MCDTTREDNANMAAAITVGAEHRITVTASARTYTAVITDVQSDRFTATDDDVTRTYLFAEVSVIRRAETEHHLHTS